MNSLKNPSTKRATHVDDDDDAGISRLLVGRSVAQVVQADATLVLDDGTRLTIVPSEGCGHCGSGYYWLEALNGCENVITSAEVVAEATTDKDDGRLRYTLFVFADNRKINLAVVEGDDGNGYYGSGFRIHVHAA